MTVPSASHVWRKDGLVITTSEPIELFTVLWLIQKFEKSDEKHQEAHGTPLMSSSGHYGGQEIAGVSFDWLVERVNDDVRHRARSVGALTV